MRTTKKRARLVHDELAPVVCGVKRAAVIESCLLTVDEQCAACRELETVSSCDPLCGVAPLRSRALTAA